jgi:LmbE family N-acetylglucosaminyl deacetylase
VNSIDNYESYAFVLAHPDDEIFTAATIRSLIRSHKKVRLIYLTTGDVESPAMGVARLKELDMAMQVIGVAPEHVLKIGSSEHDLFGNAESVIRQVRQLVARSGAQCVVSHDYEGGHDAHDLTSFTAHIAAGSTGADFWTFPAYHGQPAIRKWNQFVAGRSAHYVRILNDPDQALKRQVIAVHQSQKAFFERVLSSPSGLFLMGREALRHATGVIDYLSKPTTPLGYEPIDSPWRYDRLQSVIARNAGAARLSAHSQDLSDSTPRTHRHAGQLVGN